MIRKLLAITQFKDHETKVWDKIMLRRRYNEGPIESWLELKELVRKRFVPRARLYQREVSFLQHRGSPSHGDKWHIYATYSLMF